MWDLAAVVCRKILFSRTKGVGGCPRDKLFEGLNLRGTPTHEAETPRKGLKLFTSSIRVRFQSLAEIGR